MYTYKSNSGHEAYWNPEHTAHALTAMQEVVDESYSEGDEAIEVTRETAQQVNARYNELVANDDELNPAPAEGN